MTLVEHAEQELKLIGAFDKDSDYYGMIGDCVMELMRVFAAQGHSGGSAYLTLDIFDKVARYKALAPITSNPDEWMDVAEYTDGRSMWQNRRQGDLFSYDNGKTWYSVDDPRWRRSWWNLRARLWRRKINKQRNRPLKGAE